VAGIAACSAAEALIEAGRRDGRPLDSARITCPVRIAWGTEDRLLPWPSAAAGMPACLPHADWIELEGVGPARRSTCRRRRRG
jgi:pimeloyl-ACP methyl ester carboxylesterase